MNSISNQDLHNFLKDRLLLSTPYPVVIILLVYLSVVLKFGPAFMKNRSPYRLQKVVLVFNLTQIFVNMQMIYMVTKEIINNEQNYFCMVSNEAQWAVGYQYLLVKVLDMVETCIFVLKKNQRQVSFLHVYHHAVIFTLCYLCLQASDVCGHAIVYGIINAFVHVIMYVYYFLSAYDPAYGKISGIKKFVTRVQLIQFFILLFHFGWPLVFGHCQAPPLLCWAGVSQSIVMIILFGNFYKATYMK